MERKKLFGKAGAALYEVIDESGKISYEIVWPDGSSSPFMSLDAAKGALNEFSIREVERDREIQREKNRDRGPGR